MLEDKKFWKITIVGGAVTCIGLIGMFYESTKYISPFLIGFGLSYMSNIWGRK